MKLKEILEARPALQRLALQKMSAKVAYALAKNMKLVNAELETFEETRVKLLKENWELNPETNQYDIPPEDKEKWEEMYKELIEGEIKMDPYMIDLRLLEAVEITPGEVLAISWMIKEE